ncbi:AAA family ATPase [Thermodesulfobacteriota bacterium]
MEMSEALMDEVVKKQVEKWEESKAAGRNTEDEPLSVITVSSQPGSGGSLIAKNVAEQLGFDYFDKTLIEVIAESAHVSSKLVESVEKERFSGVEDFIASFIKKEYLYPGLYLKHLMKVVSAIALHGKAVIVGRGANFIIPPELRFSVRTVALQEKRIENIARTFEVSLDEAKGRVLQRESRRSAFVRHSFHKKVSDPVNYDIVINTDRPPIEEVVEGVCAYFQVFQNR